MSWTYQKMTLPFPRHQNWTKLHTSEVRLQTVAPQQASRSWPIKRPLKTQQLKQLVPGSVKWGCRRAVLALHVLHYSKVVCELLLVMCACRHGKMTPYRRDFIGNYHKRCRCSEMVLYGFCVSYAGHGQSVSERKRKHESCMSGR